MVLRFEYTTNMHAAHPARTSSHEIENERNVWLRRISPASAGGSGSDHHLVAGLDRSYAFPDGLDDTAGLVPQDRGEKALGVLPK